MLTITYIIFLEITSYERFLAESGSYVVFHLLLILISAYMIAGVCFLTVYGVRGHRKDVGFNYRRVGP